MHAVRSFIETLGGLWQLLRLAIKSRFRMRSAYWRWRYETAFGSQPEKFTTRRERIAAMLAYGRWIHRMRRCR